MYKLYRMMTILIDSQTYMVGSLLRFSSSTLSLYAMILPDCPSEWKGLEAHYEISGRKIRNIWNEVSEILGMEGMPVIQSDFSLSVRALDR